MKRWVRMLLIFLVTFAVLAAAALVWLWYSSSQTDDGRNTPVWTPPATPTAAAPATVTPSAVSTPLPQGCSPQKPIVPVRFVIERMGVNSEVMSLGWDPDTGAAAAPPDEAAYAVGWLNEGPKPGSEKGNVVLTIHTYHVNRALGNDLYDKDKGIVPGDVIKMSDQDGYTVCFTYRENVKVWLADYNKAPSNVLYDDHGTPQLAIIICWDYNWSERYSKSRIIFYADPISS